MKLQFKEITTETKKSAYAVIFLTLSFSLAGFLVWGSETYLKSDSNPTLSNQNNIAQSVYNPYIPEDTYEVGAAELVSNPSEEQFVDIVARDANTGEVLSAGSSSDACVSGIDAPFQPLCAQTESSYNISDGLGSAGGGGVRVRSNVDIEIVEIQYPGALLGGVTSEDLATYFSDSGFALNKQLELRQQISCRTRYLQAASELYTFNARSYMGPASEHQAAYGDLLYEPRSLMNRELNVTVDDGSGADLSKINEAVLPARDKASKKLETPWRPNMVSHFIGGSFYGPNDYFETRGWQPEMCEVIDTTTLPEIESSCYQSCFSRRIPFSAIKFIFKSAADWARCLAKPDSAECMESTIVALRIDAIFGSAYLCTERNCGVKYGDTFVNGIQSPNDKNKFTIGGVPESSSEPKAQPYYIKTQCGISLNGGAKQEIPCLWDISPYYAEFLKQKAEYPPESVDMCYSEKCNSSADPDRCAFGEYWKFVVEEIARKKNLCSN